MISRFISFLQTPVHIAPLITLRVVIGAMMLFSTLRFWWLGWIEDHYIRPIFHFKYYGFQWIESLPPFWLYTVHIVLALAALGVMIGYFFRLSSILLFITFTYTELIDLTYYLNHYYFVSLVLLMLVFTPANGSFSIDAYRHPSIVSRQVPRFWIFIFQALLAIVYAYAGLAKINYDWLVNALPLKIWLPAQDKIPLIGEFFKWQYAPYVFSWIGMIYDCTIVYWLINKRTRPWAYMAVIVFHLLTGALFQIGVFPLVMIAVTLIFFSEKWHITLLQKAERLFPTQHASSVTTPNSVPKLILFIFAAFFSFQVVFPWRYVLYPGNIFWTEEGYRFSWRVMLMEKAGTATFYVKDSTTGREGSVVNSEFLNTHQEKQMAMQPDMILQFASFLRHHYEKKGVNNPQVRAEVYVTLNARPSRLLIDPTVNLAAIKDEWQPKTWILPSPDEIQK